MTDVGEVVSDVGQKKTLKVQEVKKHAATIHCSNGLSLLQRKISNALLYHAYDDLMQKEEHEITIRELCRLIGYQGNNHTVMREALKGLLGTVIEWNVVNDVTGEEDWTASSILASVSLKGPVCLFSYSLRMKHLLHSPAMFGKINLFIQSRFNSSYGLALYENCLRYRGLGFTKWFEIEIFRKLMGVPLDKYTLFRDFKRRVLDKSVEEVNTYSDLYVSYDVRREGRRVVQLRFMLKERAKKTRLGVVNTLKDNVDENEIVITLKDEFEMSAKQAKSAIEEYGEEFIQKKISIVVATDSYKQGKVKNRTAYLISALRNDYQKKEEIRSDKPEPTGDFGREVGRLVEAVRRAWQAHREERIEAAITLMDELAQKKLVDDFRKFANSAIQTILRLQRRKYNSETVLTSPQIKLLFRQYVIDTFPEIMESIGSFDDFLLSQPKKSQEAWGRLVAWDPEAALVKEMG